MSLLIILFCNAPVDFVALIKKFQSWRPIFTAAVPTPLFVKRALNVPAIAALSNNFLSLLVCPIF